MPSLEITCTITLDDVPEVRRFVEKLHRDLVRSGDDMSRLVMTAHELLENAVKFSADGSAMLRVEIHKGREVTITTRNRARAADLQELKQVAMQLEAASDPLQFYLGLMHKSPERHGGLGLGRIAAEGEMQIRLDLHDDVVEVHARSELTPTA
jgi:hypothetical protein